MAEKKKQHYVPKLLLRLFSTDTNKKLINIFNTNNLFYRENCPLDDQAQENYFYGKDGIIEDSLADLENKVTPVLKKIIENNILPKKETEDYKTLFLFSFFLAHRTKAVSEQMNEVVNKTFQEIIKLDSRFEDIRDKDLHFWLNNAASFSLSTLSKVIFDAIDL